MKKLILLSVIFVVCASPAMATVIDTSTFEGSGYEGWGITTDGTLSTSGDWADNGPSIAGDECLLLYPVAPYPTFAGAYKWVYPTAAQSTLSEFGVTYDHKAVANGRSIYMLMEFHYTDGTPTETIYLHESAPSAWTTFTRSVTPADGGHPLEKILLKYMQHGMPAGGYWARLDNVVLTGVPEPATICILGLGSLLAIRRRNRK